MNASTAVTGHGGWPMTCILTPDGDPFFAGTYFPRPQFLALLANVTNVWTEQRTDVLASGAHIAAQLREMTAPASSASITPETLASAVAVLRQHYDLARGGFGGAPKFPPSMVLEFLIRHHARTGDADALAMARRTCDAMARGGIYDQLAGGFARYAVDADWVVPHFEKMLYDNTQLLRVYTHLWRATGESLARRIACESAEFIIRDLGTSEGGFASALDADTVIDGVSVEGATYDWTPTQLVEVLGAEDGARAAELLSVTSGGTFEHGASTLQLRVDPEDAAWWARTRAELLAARDERPQPARDDKVVTSWNGLAIAGLADVGVLLERPDFVEAAVRCAEFVVATHVVDGRLRRASRDGVVGTAAGVADDHGNLAEGLLALHQATGDPRWLAGAGTILDVALEHFRDVDGIVHDTADDAEQLFTRPRSQADNAEPSGVSSLAGAWLAYAALTGSTRHREAADAALASVGALAARDPRFAGWSLAVAEAAVAGPLQVAIVGDGPTAEAMLATARASTSPGLVIARGTPDSPGQPLLEARPLVGGEPAAYVCRGFVCDAPVRDVESLAKALARA
jgi:uncharacterized protein YyaL (SSP411 family)